LENIESKNETDVVKMKNSCFLPLELTMPLRNEKNASSIKNKQRISSLKVTTLIASVFTG